MILSLLIAVGLSQTSPPTPAFTAESAPNGLRLVEGAGTTGRELALVPLGPLTDLLRHGDAIYVAPAGGGLLVIDARVPSAPVVTAKLLDGKVVSRIGHAGEQFLFVLLADRSTVAFSVADPLHPAEATLTPPAPTRIGTVRAVRGATVMIAGGTNVGFRVGEHLKLLALGETAACSDTRAAVPGPRPTAVVVLTAVDETQAVALLGRGDTASVGSVACATMEDTTASLFGPQTPPFHWRLAATLRPFLALNDNTSAGGALVDLRAQYYFSNLPLRVGAGIAPLGLAVGGTEQHNPAIAFLDVAFSSTYVELGLGAGFSVLVNETPCTALAVCSGPEQVDPIVPVLTARFGALDGFNLTGTYAIAWSRSTFDGTRALEAAFNVPVARRLTMYLEGGGGTGFAYGEVGMRTYFGGLGGPGTVILSGGVGGAGLLDGISENPAGLAFSFGLETRL